MSLPLPTFMPIPAGTLLMGTPERDLSRLATQYGGTRESYREESPQHAVTLPAYAMAQVPITVEHGRWRMIFVRGYLHKPMRSTAYPRKLNGNTQHVAVMRVSSHGGMSGIHTQLRSATRATRSHPLAAIRQVPARGDASIWQVAYGNGRHRSTCRIRIVTMGATMHSTMGVALFVVVVMLTHPGMRAVPVAFACSPP